MRNLEAGGIRTALGTAVLGIAAVLLGAAGARALPAVSFPVNPAYSSIEIEVSFSGFADDRTVDLAGSVDTELIGILGPSPRLDFTGGTLSLGDVNLSIPGAASPVQVTSADVEAVLSGGPVGGTPVGGIGFEGEFALSGVTLTLDSGTVASQLGTTPLPTIDLSLAPVVFDLDASDTAWLSATAVGGGL